MNRCFGEVIRSGRLLFVALAVLSVSGLAGCESKDDYLDHVPPAGKGSLIIDNWTAGEVAVYVDGTNAMNVDATSSGISDMTPGTYRIVISEDGGNHSFRDYVDILEGNLTVMKIRTAAGSMTDYSVTTEFHSK